MGRPTLNDGCKADASYCWLAADHILTMQQSLTFFETMLSHDHPAYLGVLRLAYEAAKIGNDKAIIRLSMVTITFLALNVFTGKYFCIMLDSGVDLTLQT